MKIAVTSTGAELDSEMDPRFGRCPYFLFVDTEDLSHEAVKNESVTLGGGAGVQTAQMVAQRGVASVLTGNCGPNAYRALEAAGVEVIAGCSGTVRQAVQKFTSGEYKAIEQPNVASHSGQGQGNASGRGNQSP